MKNILLTLSLIFLATQLSAQTIDTVFVQGKTKKFVEGKFYLILFEKVDTLDVDGTKTQFSRSFYFDKKNRMISSVREYSNPSKPARGTQVVYSFWQNRLTKVTVTPSRKNCLECSSEYYFSGDSLSGKIERLFVMADPQSFIGNARYFQSRVPGNLEWGYFDDEQMVDGQKKKTTKREY